MPGCWRLSASPRWSPAAPGGTWGERDHMNQAIQLLHKSLRHVPLMAVTHCCCAAFSCCTASSYPWLTFFSRSLRWFSTDSISSAQPCSSRASSYSNVQKSLISTHSLARTYICCSVQYLHFTIQAFIQLPDLLSQLLYVIGLVHGVGIHLRKILKS